MWRGRERGRRDVWRDCTGAGSPRCGRLRAWLAVVESGGELPGERKVTASARLGAPHHGLSAPENGFQGEGLLALDLGNGERVRIWSAVDPRRDVPSIRLTQQGDQLVVSANGEVREETFAGTLEQALSRWAELLARELGMGPTPSLPPIWCTWYYYYTSVSEADVLENLAAMDRLGLDVGVVQIDDGYQAGIGDWLERRNSFPRPLDALAGRIRETGRRAGIWTAPFLVGARSILAEEHPDWLVGGADAGENWFQP